MPALTSAAELRAAARRGTWRGTTGGHCPANQQANLVILPQEAAVEFAAFCTRNPTPCPLIEITPPGEPEPVRSAPGADLRTDLPGYRIYRRGELAEQRGDIRDLWRDDLVAFLLGCSLTVEHALIEAGVPVRNVERDTMVSMFVSNLACVPAGRFHGPMVVTMRPIPAAQVDTCSHAVGPLPARPRCAHPRRRSGGDRDHRPGPARLRRARSRLRAGGPGLLGLRRDTAGGRGQGPRGTYDHPRARADVRDGPASRGSTHSKQGGVGSPCTEEGESYAQGTAAPWVHHRTCSLGGHHGHPWAGAGPAGDRGHGVRARDPTARGGPPHRAWCRGTRGRGTVCGGMGGRVGRLRWALRRHHPPCASHSRQAPCVPRCPGTPSTGTLWTYFRWALVGAPPCLCRPTACSMARSQVGMPPGRTTTSAGGTSRPRGSFAAPGTCGSADGNAVTRYTGRASASNSRCKTALTQGCTHACPATRRAIEPCSQIVSTPNTKSPLSYSCLYTPTYDSPIWPSWRRRVTSASDISKSSRYT